MLRQMPNLLNAGVEINEYRPVSLDELTKNNEDFKTCKTENEMIDELSGSISTIIKKNQFLDWLRLP